MAISVAALFVELLTYSASVCAREGTSASVTDIFKMDRATKDHGFDRIHTGGGITTFP
jgi:hypothetical protein